MTTTPIPVTPAPGKPWATTPRARAKEAALLLASILFTIALVQLTPLKGKLAYFFLFFIFYAVVTSISQYLARGRAAAKDAIIKAVVVLGAVITVLPIASIIITVVSKGAAGIRPGLFTNDMSMATPTDPLTNGGLLHAITGTLTLVAISLVLSVPIGILTALYLTEIKGRFTAPIRFLVQAMSGVPSIVAGLFILSAVLYPITKSYSGFMGALALTILMIPTITRTSEEVLLLKIGRASCRERVSSPV